MEKTMNRECELKQEINQEQDSKVDQSANSLDEDALDSITGGANQVSADGFFRSGSLGGSNSSPFKPQL